VVAIGEGVNVFNRNIVSNDDGVILSVGGRGFVDQKGRGRHISEGTVIEYYALRD